MLGTVIYGFVCDGYVAEPCVFHVANCVQFCVLTSLRFTAHATAMTDPARIGQDCYATGMHTRDRSIQINGLCVQRARTMVLRGRAGPSEYSWVSPDFNGTNLFKDDLSALSLLTTATWIQASTARPRSAEVSLVLVRDMSPIPESSAREPAREPSPLSLLFRRPSSVVFPTLDWLGIRDGSGTGLKKLSTTSLCARR